MVTAPNEPLLRGVEADRARAAVRDLSSDFLEMRTRGLGPGLAEGVVGLALAHAAFERALPGRGHAARARRALGCSARAIAKYRTGPSLYTGFTGVAWATELIDGSGDDGERESDVDGALHEVLSNRPWVYHYDLVVGLAGIGVYALERLPRPSARRLVALTVNRLAEAASARAPGLAWWSNPAWVEGTPNASRHPWNLGLAHGAPGVIGMLGRVCAAKVPERTRTKAKALLDGAVAWLLAQELPHGGESCFAFAADEGDEPARIAWCYGDPGIASALMVAARCTGNGTWARVAKRLALRAAARSRASSEVTDAGLCHGSAGLAHVFHRLYRATGDERLADTARLWFSRTLARRSVWSEQGPGFLTGVAGVALAVMSATGDADPTWDRCLLLSARELGD